ncbi:MAG: TMEM165/GDT1 family protein [Myxococcales bacterium]|nr:TMEM165/GDT1 family protein [Myxococcales bacterium]
MDMKLFVTVFSTVFLAELGDKTQLATLLYAADAKTSKWIVFSGAALALVATSALGVLGGALISRYVSDKALHWVAGLGFIAVGLWTLVKA